MLLDAFMCSFSLLSNWEFGILQFDQTVWNVYPVLSYI